MRLHVEEKGGEGGTLAWVGEDGGVGTSPSTFQNTACPLAARRQVGRVWGVGGEGGPLTSPSTQEGTTSLRPPCLAAHAFPTHIPSPAHLYLPFLPKP